MPAPERDHRHQKTVLWSFVTTDKNGQPLVAPPRQLNETGWMTGIRESIDQSANPIAISATVDVNEEIPIFSIMRLGALTDVPSPPNNLHQVVDIKITPDVKGREIKYTVMLSRWQKPLPRIIS
jgi:hypothetical protein